MATAGTQLLVRDGFALMRVLCHAVFCVLAPLGSWRGVVLLRRRRPAGLVVGFGLLLLGLAAEGVYLYARNVEPFRLQVVHERVSDPRLDGLDRPIKIVAVADVQTLAIGDYELEVRRRIDAEQADLIVFLGDYVQRPTDEPRQYERELQRFRDWILGLEHRPRLGIFAVDGDVEWRTDALHGAATTLRDTAVSLPTEVPIQLVGLSMPESHRPLSPRLGRQLLDFEGFSIVIAHAPDYMLWCLDGGHQPEALMLAGHCHGGQVAIPGFGPLLTLSAIPRALAYGELWQRGRSWLRVSRGVGIERANAPPIRLFSPPELVVIELGGPAGR